MNYNRPDVIKITRFESFINIAFSFFTDMGFIVPTLKWSVKLGLSGGTVYLAHQNGLFGNADQAQQGLKQLKSDVKTTISQNIPKELMDSVPEIPEVNVKDIIPVEVNINGDARGLWNRGVLATFAALVNAPESIKGYSKELVKFVEDQTK